MSEPLTERLRKEALDAKHMYPRTGTLVSVLEEAADVVEQPNTIYIVEGRTGEYEDKREWTVCAFKDEVKANELKDKAQRRGKEIAASMKGYLYPMGSKGVNEFDSGMDIIDGIIEYIVYPTELR